jgi:hypothetical protein
VPQLPNTGSGGLLRTDSQASLAPWLLAGLALVTTVLAASRLAYRRLR